MIRLLTFLFLACVSGASYATCSGGSISYGPPISVDLSDKLTPATAENMAWEFSSDGAALGAIHPDMIRRMFDQAHAAIPKEKWERMRSAGLNIPPEQDVMSYEETEQGENEGFMAYCQQCCPDLYSVLRK